MVPPCRPSFERNERWNRRTVVWRLARSGLLAHPSCTMVGLLVWCLVRHLVPHVVLVLVSGLAALAPKRELGRAVVWSTQRRRRCAGSSKSCGRQATSSGRRRWCSSAGTRARFPAVPFTRVAAVCVAQPSRLAALHHRRQPQSSLILFDDTVPSDPVQQVRFRSRSSRQDRPQGSKLLKSTRSVHPDRPDDAASSRSAIRSRSRRTGPGRSTGTRRWRSTGVMRGQKH